MTKRVRVENGDTSDHKIVVEVWERSIDGNADVKVGEHKLDYPTAQTPEDLYIWDTRYLIVREYK